MATNLRVEFCKMQHKHLSESIDVDLSPSKEAYLVPGPDSPSKSTPLTPTIVVALGLDNKPLSVGNIPYHKMKSPLSSEGALVGIHSSV